MRALLVAVLVAVPVLAGAQSAPWNDESWWEEWGQASMASGSTTVLSAPLSAPGCYASPTQQGSALVTVTRATSQTINSGTTTCAVNELGVESAGASIWKAATNSVLNSGTHPKIAEATASLGTGSYVGWHAGTGTMTIAAGTATVTGLSCTAVSPGTLCPFTVTVAGTMAVTTSAGTVTQAQIEPGAYATPYIPTAAAAVTRNATVASAPLPALGNKWCAAVTYTPGQNWSDTSTRYLWSTYVGVVANSMNLSRSGGNVTFNVFDSAGGARSVTWVHGLTGTVTKRLVGCNNNGALSFCADGVAVGSLGGAGTAIQTATLTPIYTGSQNGTAPIDGNIKDVKICKGATKCSDCR